MLHRMARITEIVVRRLMHFPLMRHDEQGARAGREHASHFAQDGAGIPNVLEGHDADRRFEAAVRKRQSVQVGNSVELAVIPSVVADAEIDAYVSLPGKKRRVPHLARAGVQNARTRRERLGERRHGVLDGRLEVEKVAGKKPRQQALDRSISQAFLRASTMIVEPAPKAASTTANGSETSTMPK